VERQRQLEHLVQHCAGCVGVIVTSARTGRGRTQLWALIRRTLDRFRHQHTVRV
jgi:hypothetical protein